MKGKGGCIHLQTVGKPFIMLQCAEAFLALPCPKGASTGKVPQICSQLEVGGGVGGRISACFLRESTAAPRVSVDLAVTLKSGVREGFPSLSFPLIIRNS